MVDSFYESKFMHLVLDEVDLYETMSENCLSKISLSQFERNLVPKRNNMNEVKNVERSSLQ